MTKILHNHLYMYSLKRSYCVAISQLCVAIAQSNICGGAGGAIVMSAPSLLEVFAWLPAGHHVSYTGQKRPHQLIRVAATWSLLASLLPAACRLSLCLHRC